MSRLTRSPLQHFKKHVLSRLVFVLVSITVLTLAPIYDTAAINLDIYSQNNIPPLFDDEAVACSASGSGTLVGGENLEKIYNFLIAKGLKPIHAAAAVGNIATESAGAADPLIVERLAGSGLPFSTNDPSSLPVVSGWPGGQTRQPGWGLIQWTPSKKFEQIIKDNNLPATKPYELAAQLEVIWWHIEDTTPTGRTDFYDKFTATTNLKDATEIFMTDYEAPGVPHFESRLANAQAALDDYGDGDPSAAGSLSSNGCYTGSGAAADATGVVAKALEYAWPDQRNTLTLKPEYADAIRTAKANGENVNGYGRGGQSSLDGVDCHIFVKRVMRDSGADPDYSTDYSIDQGMTYMSNSNKYIEYTPQSQTDLVPGTIIGYNIGVSAGQPGRHMLIYVGKNDVLQNGIEVAEASLPDKAPRAGWTDPMGGPYKDAHRYFRLATTQGDDFDPGGEQSE